MCSTPKKLRHGESTRDGWTTSAPCAPSQLASLFTMAAEPLTFSSYPVREATGSWALRAAASSCSLLAREGHGVADRTNTRARVC